MDNHVLLKSFLWSFVVFHTLEFVFQIEYECQLFVFIESISVLFDDHRLIFGQFFWKTDR